MQVEDGLPRLGADVRHHPVPVAQPGIIRDAAHGREQRGEDWSVLVGEGVRVRDVAPRDDEDVRRRARVDVPEGDDVIVLEHAVGRDLSRDDLAEEAVGVAIGHATTLGEVAGPGQDHRRGRDRHRLGPEDARAEAGGGHPRAPCDLDLGRAEATLRADEDLRRRGQGAEARAVMPLEEEDRCRRHRVGEADGRIDIGHDATLGLLGRLAGDGPQPFEPVRR